VKLLLDEHFSPEIARQLRTRGREVVAARGRTELHGLSDRELLIRAASEGRALVTENVAGFVALHREFIVSGDRHLGLVLTSSKQFPRSRRTIGRLVRALDALLVEHPGRDDLTDQVWWLR
jgi:predicted nuclease of predicted toxin-antitoxin system